MIIVPWFPPSQLNAAGVAFVGENLRKENPTDRPIFSTRYQKHRMFFYV